MIEEKEEAAGPTGMPANDRGGDPGDEDARDFSDEGAPASPEERLAVRHFSRDAALRLHLDVVWDVVSSRAA